MPFVKYLSIKEIRQYHVQVYLHGGVYTFQIGVWGRLDESKNKDLAGNRKKTAWLSPKRTYQRGR